jgi:hypothetical protein
MRAISSSFMATLLLVALFWGNCFSCPQMMLSRAAMKSHACCKRGQKPMPNACSSQGMKHFVKAESAATVAPVPATAPVETDAAVAAPVWRAVESVPVETNHAPPDLLALHSSLRI